MCLTANVLFAYCYPFKWCRSDFWMYEKWHFGYMKEALLRQKRGTFEAEKRHFEEIKQHFYKQKECTSFTTHPHRHILQKQFFAVIVKITLFIM